MAEVHFVEAVGGGGAQGNRLADKALAEEVGTIAPGYFAFGISRDIGYKWLRRFEEEGAAALEDRSRKPHRSPHATVESVRERLLELRKAHPALGGAQAAATTGGLGDEWLGRGEYH